MLYVSLCKWNDKYLSVKKNTIVTIYVRNNVDKDVIIKNVKYLLLQNIIYLQRLKVQNLNYVSLLRF